MPYRTDARRRINVALRRYHLAHKIANRLQDQNDKDYVTFLLNKANRYKQLAEAIAINELNEMPGNNRDYSNRLRRTNNQVNKVVNSIPGCLQT